MSDDKIPDILALRPGWQEGTREGPGKLPIPPEYSENLVIAICNCIMRTGVHPEVAAAGAGLTNQKFFEWKRSVDIGAAHSKIIEMFDAIANAEAMYEIQFVDGLNKDLAASDKLKMISMRFKDRWSQQLKLTLDRELESAALRLEGLRNIDRLMTGEEALVEVLKLLGG